MQRAQLQKLGLIDSVTILSETRIVYCTRLKSDKLSKAIIYDTHIQKNIFEIEGQPKCQIIFFRTNLLNHVLYYNQGPEHDSMLKLKTQDELEEWGTFSKPFRENLHDANTFLFDIQNLNTFSDSIRWLADNVIKINGKKIYIEKPLKKHASTMTSYEKYGTINIRLLQNNTNYIEIYSNIYWMTEEGGWSNCPGFYINWRNNQNVLLYNTRINILLKSCCCISQNRILIGAYSQSNTAPSFSVMMYDFTRNQAIEFAFIDNVLKKLIYIPEKDVTIGIVENASNVIYLFDSNLNYKKIYTKDYIMDIAISNHFENKIIFEGGDFTNLEQLINPELKLYAKKINEAVPSLPNTLNAIIMDYAFKKNPYSSFFQPKKQPNFVESCITKTLSIFNKKNQC